MINYTTLIYTAANSPDFLSFAMSFLAASEFPVFSSAKSSVVFPITAVNNVQVEVPKIVSCFLIRR